MDPRIRRADTFRIKDGELYYICKRIQNKTEHLAKVVSTAEEADQLFKEFHSSNIGGHCGVEKTHCALIARYYWPGMESDIRKWIAQCPQCQAKRANIKEKQEYSPIEVTEPLELVGMDFVGKLTVNSALCERLDIKRSLCSAYHPQTNGLVEKLNGTIQRTLNKMVAGHPKRWDQVLQSTMFALRTKKQLTTKYSPYYLMFGREARYPSEVPEEYVVKEDKVSKLVEREEIHEGLKKQEAVFTEVKINMKISQDKVRKRKIERGQEDNFQVGDQVLRRNVRQEQRKGGKLEDDWLGPYSILELEGKKAIVGKGTTKLQTNIDHLTHYFQPEERIPAKLQKLSDPSPLIVNSYLTMVGRKAGALLIDSYLMTSLWEGTHKGSLRTLDLFKHDMAVGAVCHNGHWTLIERRSLFVNPFGATYAQIDRCKDVTGALVRKKCPGIGRWACATVAHPQQNDTSSCGVFVCKIECTTCQMWYHLGCVGLASPTEDDYCCPSCKS
ncbi:hypothetical protein KUCAC02_021462 [Chaenocephalus aceratus]|uniref:Uncharacterized protein n=1 Tax=Chaenocephalus aceratus TaxID=36190 RepID=A0ACB9XFM1_CHAAC|nr:hypothetical protein KUCAC02_021462 [Chaenocephalus aceratus]